ncbi:substrate-binding domain-containing protein [Rhodopirellula sallentina]|nr:substrate-binding domain-containing protein [Rhodopirellula sallentina]
MTRVPRILLLIETSKAYGRRLLEGIGRYAETHGRWSMYVEERGLHDRQPAWLKSWQGDGIIFRSMAPSMINAIRTSNVPAVDTNSKITDHGFPLVYADEQAIARVAVEHFRGRGFVNVGFCAIENDPWVTLRHDAYQAETTRHGFHCHCWLAPKANAGHGWERQSRQLSSWVDGLPKPIAIFAANDVAGMRLVDACNRADVAVPEQVAVLGADNDEVLDMLTSPPLSSIDPDAARIGFEAARLLDRMIRGEPWPAEPLLIVPAGVVSRQSTDITAVDDPQLAVALTFIRHHACDGISVDDVTRVVDVSRATLERRFASHLNRTPKEEIFRVRMEHVERFVTRTDDSLAEIAGRTGFATASHLSTAFKRTFGKPPNDYRKDANRG